MADPVRSLTRGRQAYRLASAGTGFGGGGGQGGVNIIDDGKKVEFVCAVRLHAVYALDTDRPPHCWRGHGRMEADDMDIIPKARPPRPL